MVRTPFDLFSGFSSFLAIPPSLCRVSPRFPRMPRPPWILDQLESSWWRRLPASLGTYAAAAHQSPLFALHLHSRWFAAAPLLGAATAARDIGAALASFHWHPHLCWAGETACKLLEDLWKLRKTSNSYWSRAPILAYVWPSHCTQLYTVLYAVLYTVLFTVLYCVAFPLYFTLYWMPRDPCIRWCFIASCPTYF